MPRLYPSAALAALLLAISLSGCVSHWRGKEMETSLVALQGQIESLKESQREAREKTQQSFNALAERFGQIETQIGKAVEQLQRSSAEGGLLIQQLQDQLRKSEGEIFELKKQLEEGGGGAGVPVVAPPPGAPPLPEGAAELYKYGWDKKNASECTEAIRAFAEFARKFPGNNRADNAIFLMAECQTQLQDYTGSIKALQIILQKYNDGDKIDDALVLMHDNFVALNRCKDGVPFLETLIADYPRSDRVAEARQKLAKAKKTCK